MLDLRLRAFLFALWIVSLQQFAYGENRHLTLKGKLFIGDGDCHFFTDPEGESPSVGLDASSSDALCDYLTGSNASRVVITIGPADPE